MRVSAVRASLLFVLFCLGVFHLGAQVPSRIVERIDVKHVGPPAASDELVRANIRLKVGEPYQRSNADDDVRSLYATGYFYNIRIGEEFTDKGVILTYVVQGKPTLTEIRFQGNTKISRSNLLKKVHSKVGEPLNERRLFADAEEIKKHYQSKGYPQTEVKYVVTIDENAGRGTATFEVSEKPRVRVVDVQFSGATAFTQRKLRGELKTKRWWMFSWITGGGKLKDEDFDEDKETLLNFYRDAGYVDFAIKDIQMDYLQPTRLVIRFVVSEGVQYKIGAVSMKGATNISSQVIVPRLPVSTGKTFTPKGLSRDLEFIENVYGAKGYVDARINASKIANTETGTMDLVFVVDEKQPSYIEKIEIKGNTKTKDRVVRRELAVAPGELFDMVRVKLSTNRLAGLNYFEKIDAKPEPTEVPNRKNLVIGVEEKSTGNFTVGAGFSSVDNLVGFVEVSQGNFDLLNPWFFTGGGQKFRLRTQIGTERQDYLLSFIEPWFLGRKLALSVDLYHRDLNFQSSLYNERRTGAKFGLTRALGSDFLIGSLHYTIERAGILNVSSNASPALQAEEGLKLVSKIGGSIAYDTRNSALLPNRGQRTEVSAELAGGPFGGEVDFYKLELRSSWYFKGFAPGHVLEVVGRVGAGQAYNRSADLPLFDRYFLGGLYSLRGFDYRSVGPKDANNEPLGGDTYYFGSAEYSIPIIERLRFALFYDVGMVFAKPFSFDPGSYNTGVYNDNFGFGIRLNLPIGPLRLDYGIPITSDPNNKGSGKFQFGVGYTREL